MTLRTFATFALLAATSFVACGGTAKHEAATLVAAVDRYRRVDNASKVAEVEKVAGIACTDPEVCSAKRVCLAAIGPTARALALKDEVARRLADVEQKRISRESPDVQALPGKLDDAERLLNEGRAKMPDCEKQLAELEVEYGV